MLHRLSLRVLPQLSLAVTEPDARMRKRWVMFVVGFAAFVAFRLAKFMFVLSEPLMLLGFAGVFASVTSGVSYAVGRRVGLPALLTVESPRRWAWLLGWIGAVYGIQLALLVLALLQVGVNYDYLVHPDGPAMMAIIISCTAVGRDAFEIGHLRWLESKGRSFLTFPDGGSLRGLLFREPKSIAAWVLVGLLACGLSAWGVGHIGPWGTMALTQLLLAALLGGSVALIAYLDGLGKPERWWVRWRRSRWIDLATFWWWPGLAFAATYFLVLYGVSEFVVRGGDLSAGHFSAMSGSIGGLMAAYGYYLGARRSFEDRIHAAVPASMLRCPFIMGLLGRHNGRAAAPPLEAAGLTESPRAVRMEQGR